jgi:hypothetical protein
MNWTTTKVPLWQIDCENFRKVGRPFELRDVTTTEHWQFVKVFGARYAWNYTKEGSTVRFEPERNA